MLLRSVSDITKCDRLLLQGVSDITKCGRRYYKVCQVLQSAAVVTDWDIITGAFILICHGKYTNFLENTYEWEQGVLSLVFF